jgi:hypothetical protein
MRGNLGYTLATLGALTLLGYAGVTAWDERGHVSRDLMSIKAALCKSHGIVVKGEPFMPGQWRPRSVRPHNVFVMAGEGGECRQWSLHVLDARDRRWLVEATTNEADEVIALNVHPVAAHSDGAQPGALSASSQSRWLFNFASKPN